jgi:hypothetical protein
VGERFGGGRCFVLFLFLFFYAFTICVKFILKVVENESYTTYKELSIEGQFEIVLKNIYFFKKKTRNIVIFKRGKFIYPSCTYSLFTNTFQLFKIFHFDISNFDFL